MVQHVEELGHWNCLFEGTGAASRSLVSVRQDDPGLRPVSDYHSPITQGAAGTSAFQPSYQEDSGAGTRAQGSPALLTHCPPGQSLYQQYASGQGDPLPG